MRVVVVLAALVSSCTLGADLLPCARDVDCVPGFRCDERGACVAVAGGPRVDDPAGGDAGATTDDDAGAPAGDDAGATTGDDAGATTADDAGATTDDGGADDAGSGGEQDAGELDAGAPFDAGPPPVTVDLFFADPAPMPPASAFLHWTSTNATECFLDGSGTPVATEGVLELSRSCGSEHSLRCVGPGGEATDTASVAPRCRLPLAQLIGDRTVTTDGEATDLADEIAAAGRCVEITGALVVDGLQASSDLGFLYGVDTVRGDFVVKETSSVQHGDALCSVYEIGGDLVVTGNDSLQRLDGLRPGLLGHGDANPGVSIHGNPSLRELFPIPLGILIAYTDTDVRGEVFDNDSLTTTERDAFCSRFAALGLPCAIVDDDLCPGAE